MSLANVKNASSTFMEALADVSMNLIPYSMASSSPRSLDTYKNYNYYFWILKKIHEIPWMLSSTELLWIELDT